jgi:hypothetical protein
VLVGGRNLAPSQSLLSSGLTVGPQDRSLEIEFAALDFTDPDLRRYSYRLQGFNKDLLPTRTCRRATTFCSCAALPPAVDGRRRSTLRCMCNRPGTSMAWRARWRRS